MHKYWRWGLICIFWALDVFHLFAEENVVGIFPVLQPNINSSTLICREKNVVFDKRSWWLHHRFAREKQLTMLWNFLNIFYKERRDGGRFIFLLLCWGNYLPIIQSFHSLTPSKHYCFIKYARTDLMMKKNIEILVEGTNVKGQEQRMTNTLKGITV